MSWCRWGSACLNTVPPFKVNENCHPSGRCPGSDLYIYEDAEHGLTCCDCPLNGGERFFAKDVDEMRAHCVAHREAGHHVRASLLSDAPREVVDGYNPAEHCLEMAFGSSRAIVGTTWAKRFGDS